MSIVDINIENQTSAWRARDILTSKCGLFLTSGSKTKSRIPDKTYILIADILRKCGEIWYQEDSLPGDAMSGEFYSDVFVLVLINLDEVL